MKALSISQPWAWLIVNEQKDVEIRRWNTKFRGEFLIHTGKKIDLESCRMFDIDPKSLIIGAIVGKARLIDVIKYWDSHSFLLDKERHLNPPDWFSPPLYGFVLTDIRKLEPIPFKGKLGFFEVDWDG